MLRASACHGLPDLFPRSQPVDMVHLVQVDVIGLQSTQAVFAGLSDVVGGQTGRWDPDPWADRPWWPAQSGRVGRFSQTSAR